MDCLRPFSSDVYNLPALHASGKTFEECNTLCVAAADCENFFLKNDDGLCEGSKAGCGYKTLDGYDYYQKFD